MDVYVFSSNNLTNIWAGVGAGRWAVSMNLAQDKATITKSKSLQIGALGLIYCSETQEFTTPFIVKSLPVQGSTIKDIWPEEWGLPFGILPLGTPHSRLHKDSIANNMPSAAASKAQWNRILYVQPNFSFQASKLSKEDWSYLFRELAT